MGEIIVIVIILLTVWSFVISGIIKNIVGKRLDEIDNKINSIQKDLRKRNEDKD